MRNSECGIQNDLPAHSPFRILHSPFGMTLVELLVVLGIIGLIVGIGVPGFVSYSKQLRLKTSTRKVVGLVSLARSIAISSRESQAVIVDLERKEVRIVNAESGEEREGILRLPSSLTIQLSVGGEPAEQGQFVFRPMGSLTGRTVSLLLSNSEKSQTVVVTAATGAITVK